METFPKFLKTLRNLLGKCANNNTQYEYYFRGEAKNHPSVIPSVYTKDLIRHEDTLFKECLRMAPYEFNAEDTTFEKLVKMQHYSLPTRLLDITSNPLVALFFATEQRDNADGRVIVFRVPLGKIKFSDSDTVAVISNICKLPYDSLDISSYNKTPNESDAGFIARFNKKKNIRSLLHEIKADKPYFESCIRKCDMESVWCVKPMMRNPRIIKQDGSFLLFGINGTKQSCASLPNCAKKYTENVSSDIVISKIFPIAAADKKKIRGELDNLGFSEEKLYPDLEHTAKKLKERYSNEVTNPAS